MGLRATEFTGADGRLRGTLWMGVLESDEHEREAEVGRALLCSISRESEPGSDVSSTHSSVPQVPAVCSAHPGSPAALL